MNNIKLQDLKFGFNNEKIILQLLQSIDKFKDIKKTENHYDTFDFYNDNVYIELKSRRIHYGQYPDIMISKNKIDEGLEHTKNGKEVFILWKCLNGTFGWKVNEEEFSQLRVGSGGTTRRGCDETADCYFVKNDLIKPFADLLIV